MREWERLMGVDMDTSAAGFRDAPSGPGDADDDDLDIDLDA